MINLKCATVELRIVSQYGIWNYMWRFSQLAESVCGVHLPSDTHIHLSNIYIYIYNGYAEI